MLFRVKAIFEYSSPHEDDLSFPVGQVISVTEEEDDDWYVGEYADASGSIKSGLFPKNFVEKYEPEPPPRPTRPTRQKQAEAPAPQPASEPAPEPPAEEPREEPLVPPASPKPEPEKAAPIPVEPPQSQPEVAAPVPPPAAPAASQAPAPKPAPTQPPAPKPAPAAAAPAPAPAPAAKSPPAVAEKPSSFKDRIAAFNKAAAAPIAPFKPGGAPSTFIKKPFVAPPPSRNAYVPPPREAPAAKIYRRDEDPEVAEKVAQDQELAERAGLASSSTQEQAEEDAPKPTSLKERIALLQKQQMEQARRAEASHKEKPKRPPKKRTESHEPPNEDEATPEASARASSDVPRDVPRQPAPRRPSHGQKPSEVLSDANDADQSAAGETTEDAEGTSTSVEEDEERKARTAPKPAAAPSQEQAAEAVEEEEEEEEEGSEEEEDEIDEETRRRMELRERMAKMSGGMGMAGMFGGFPMGGGAAPPKKKKAPPAPERKATDDSLSSPPPARIAMVPVPGMASVRSPEPEDKQLEEPQAVSPATVQPDDVEPRSPPQSSHGLATQQSPTEQETSGAGERSPPPVPSERPVPVPLEARPVPAPPAPIQSPSAGSESDDEMPGNARERPVHDPAPPVPPLASRPDHAGPIQSPPAVPKRTSYIGSSPTSPETPNAPTGQERRSSRVPPIPGTIPPMSPPLQSRPPPPPPPTSGPPSRQPTFENPPRRSIAGDDDEGETEYEGDYDTDIAPGATHKDALKAHAREASLDGSTTADEAPVRSPVLPPAGPPPIPTSSAPRAVPPPLPSQPPPHRQSMDAPRAPPPPVPPPKEATVTEDQDDEYDPYKYTASPPRAVPPVPKASAPMNVPPSSPPAAPPSLPPSAPPAAPPRIPPPSFHPQEYQEASDDDELYASPPPRKSVDRAPPPPPAQHPPLPERHLPPPPPPQGPPPSATARKSLDISRISTSLNRRSMDQPRASTDTGFIANDVDLGYNSQWWAQPNTPPPVFQNRKDVQIEFGEPPANPGEYYKQVYVLFQDYSQTIITAQFDPRNPREANLEQRHEPPPPRPRPDQLEAAYSRYGAAIASAVASKQNAVIDDGTPHGLVLSLLRGVPGALLPVGTRSYGALVYANIANATVKSDDEIRPGDIISFRNARFQGKHGAMHAKYSMDVGKPDHVGIVMDWDGTKKKIRAYDQGRESKKVKVESFRVGDLRSGEVRVWRVMGKSWVGWPDDA